MAQTLDVRVALRHNTTTGLWIMETTRDGVAGVADTMAMWLKTDQRRGDEHLMISVMVCHGDIWTVQLDGAGLSLLVDMVEYVNRQMDLDRPAAMEFGYQLRDALDRWADMYGPTYPASRA
jgi:hypothetical protein